MAKRDGLIDTAAPLDLSRAQAKLDNVKRAIVADMRPLIEDGRFHLRGVQTTPDARTFSEILPSVWAADFEMNLDTNAVEFHGRRFVRVRAFAGAASAHDVPKAATALRPEDVPQLSDEAILTLLEEHAKRVVENDTPMFPPGKISLMPIIRRKMEYRAKAGELESKLASEAAFLFQWIMDRLPSHQTPTAATIENSLRNNYAALKARSTATKA
jgi:hypothetical protein